MIKQLLNNFFLTATA